LKPWHFRFSRGVIYVWSVIRRNWRELYTPGILWVAGLILGVFVLADLLALGFTSRDAAVKSMGGRKWKRLHRTVYVTPGLALLHGVCVGAGSGLHRGR
jgi:DMSO/TMAO reductase YedYZ heme-binding membrane subunit